MIILLFLSVWRSTDDVKFRRRKIMTSDTKFDPRTESVHELNVCMMKVCEYSVKRSEITQ